MSLRIQVDDEVELRLPQPGDAAALFRLIENSRDWLRTWLPWLDDSNSATTSDFVQSNQVSFDRGMGFNFLILYNGVIAGVIGFHAFDNRNRVTSLGYWLAKPFAGRGIMTRAARACVSYAFRDRDMNRVYLRCATGNEASRRVAMRIGMKHEGTQREAEWLYDRFVDLDVYAILRAEWEPPKAS